MGSVELSDLEKKVLPNCDFIWSQKVANHAERILSGCSTDEDVRKFFSESEDRMRAMQKCCRITWNSEVFKFGGEEFGYIMYFYSDILDAAIKVSVNIDVLSQMVSVGNMEIANVKERRKLDQHLDSSTEKLKNSQSDSFK